jgi:hypothetical protein
VIGARARLGYAPIRQASLTRYLHLRHIGPVTTPFSKRCGLCVPSLRRDGHFGRYCRFVSSRLKAGRLTPQRDEGNLAKHTCGASTQTIAVLLGVRSAVVPCIMYVAAMHAEANGPPRYNRHPGTPLRLRPCTPASPVCGGGHLSVLLNV